MQRGEAKLLTEDWEGAVEDMKSAAEKSPQVIYFELIYHVPDHNAKLEFWSSFITLIVL